MENLADAILNIIKDTPSIAIWVLVIIYGYKVVIVGSLYGVIRFVVDRAHSVMTTPKHTLQVVDIEAKLRSLTIPDCHDNLIAQIERIRSDTDLGHQYIHQSNVNWLRRAIDTQKEKDAAKQDKNQ